LEAQHAIPSATAGNGCVQSELSSKIVVPVHVAVAVKVHDPVKVNVNDYGRCAAVVQETSVPLPLLGEPARVADVLATRFVDRSA